MGWLVLVHAMLAWATHGLAVADHTARDHVHRRLVNRDTKDGLIYIDCGVLKSWRDDNESIHYMSDVSYTDTGRNMNISSDLMSSVPKIYHTVRSFPGASKSCYTFKSLQKGNTYLIRAHFMYGNYDGKNSLPVFDVYFGVNYWVRLQLESETRKMMRELIHSPTTGSIDVCLVDIGLGTPFISELDLRPLKNPIYRAPYGSLQTYYRYNIGSSKSSETYSRFSEDGYDRLWISPPSSLSSSWKPLQVDVRKFLSTNSYELPPEVLQTAAKPASGQYSLVFPWIMPNWTAEYYVYWHFVELENLGNNELRQFNIYAGSNFQYGPVTLKYLQPLTVASRGITLTDSSILFSLNKTSSSTYPPILNAVEIYGVIKLPKSSTNQQEVDAITDIKNMYGLMKVWQGDPCLPINYSWDGVSCSYNGDDAPRITSL